MKGKAASVGGLFGAMSPFGRLCCKSLFVPLNTIFPGYRRGDRIIMWGTTSTGVELTGNFGGALEDTWIGDCRLVRLLAENWSRGVLGLLQHNRHLADVGALPKVRLAPEADISPIHCYGTFKIMLEVEWQHDGGAEHDAARRALP